MVGHLALGLNLALLLQTLDNHSSAYTAGQSMRPVTACLTKGTQGPFFKVLWRGTYPSQPTL